MGKLYVLLQDGANYQGDGDRFGRKGQVVEGDTHGRYRILNPGPEQSDSFFSILKERLKEL